MIIAIDIGNTNIKIGVFENRIFKGSFRLSSQTHRTSDEFGIAIINQLKFWDIDSKKIKGVIISSVNPSFNYTFDKLSQYYFNVRAIFVSSKLKTPLDLSLDVTGDMGADRVASCVGAVTKYKKPCLPMIVFDFGTATVCNVLDGNNKFLGGSIMQGLRTSADSLAQSAAKLPCIELVLPHDIIATTTVTNMQAGLIYGHIGAVEYIINKTKQRLRELDISLNMQDIPVIATGGLSEIIVQGSKVFDVVDRMLTLDGLCEIYYYNRLVP